MKYLFVISWFALLYFAIDGRIQVEGMKLDLQMAQERIAQLSKTETFEPKKKSVRFEKSNQVRSKLFSYLYQINKDQKKIKYTPGLLEIEDFTLSKNDLFLDMLDMLFEQEQLVMIEVPKNQEIKDDLKLAGFSSDFLTQSKDRKWLIKIKE